MAATRKRKRGNRHPATTIQTVALRLDEIQDLMVEMRGALDFQLRAIKKLQLQVDQLKESRRRRSAREFYAGEPPAVDVAHEPSAPRK